MLLARGLLSNDDQKEIKLPDSDLTTLMNTIQGRLKPIEPIALAKGGATESIVPKLSLLSHNYSNNNNELAKEYETVTSEAFEYPHYKSKDITLG